MTKKEKKLRKQLMLEEKYKKNRKSKKFKNLNLFTGVLLGMFLTISAYLVYNIYKLSGIENVLRYVIMILFIILGLFLIVKYLKMRRKPLLSKYIIFIFLLLIMGSIEYFAAYTIHKGLNVVDNISAKKYKTYSTSLISLKDGNLQTVSDISSDTKIGRVNNKDDIEGYKLTKYIMKKDNIDKTSIENYDDPVTMLYDLYDEKIDAIFIASNYKDVYGTTEKFENIASETIELDKYKKRMKIQDDDSLFANSKPITKPFTMLLMGVDSTEEDLTAASGLGDSLMLITFNPNTLNATILSIPRDTFLPISCYRNARSKITHAASGGDKCMINTIQNAFDVNIDYYAKINFRGLMKLVDAMDGIDVEVPYAFCETTLWRSEEYMVYVEKGLQHLNGEQALALSRNRKTYKRCGSKWNKGTRDDFVRGQNQQLVINAMINKMKSIKSITQFYALLDAVGSSMTTNMDRKQILSFYNVFKKIIINSKDLTDGNDIINLQKMYLNGTGGLYQDGIMNMELYEYIPSNQSLNAIKNAMKVNLELKSEKPATSFSFSADEEYEQKVIGKNLSGGVDKPTSTKSSSESKTNECSTNEELGADGKTCVCKWGYERQNGVCIKKEEEKKTVTCENGTINGSKCICWSGYEDLDNDGICTKKEEEEKITCENGTIEGGKCTCWSGYEDPDNDGICTQKKSPNPGTTEGDDEINP